MPGARLPRSRAVPAALIGASLCAAAITALRDPPAKPPHFADDKPRPSGRRHVNDCPLRNGIGADVEAAWSGR